MKKRKTQKIEINDLLGDLDEMIESLQKIKKDNPEGLEFSVYIESWGYDGPGDLTIDMIREESDVEYEERVKRQKEILEKKLTEEKALLDTARQNKLAKIARLEEQLKELKE